MGSYDDAADNFTTSHDAAGRRRTTQYEDDVVKALLKYTNIQRDANSVLEKVDTFLLCLGIFGNLIAITTMAKSRSMRTPSFVYHKILVVADLIFCVNFLLVKFIDQTQTISVRVPGLNSEVTFYYSPVLAFYTTVLTRALTSSAGYVALYMSLGIGVDRFVALWLIFVYDKFNKKSVAWLLVTVSLALSILVHSWATWFEREVKDTRVTLPTAHDMNATVVLYQSVPYQMADMDNWIKAKDVYNMALRLCYPVVLTVLTGLVIYAFNLQQRKKRSMTSSSTSSAGGNKRQGRRDRCLFYLMIAVVVLSFMQVIPRECRRILELIYPKRTVMDNMRDYRLPLETRMKYFYIMTYGLDFSKIILNTLTVFDRSLIFYLYFALNHSFRKEVLRVFKLAKFFYGRRKSVTSFASGVTGENSRKASTGSNKSTKSPRHSLASPLIRRSSASPYDLSEFSSTGF